MDVDGSYLHKKCLRLEASSHDMVLMLPQKPTPLSGWEVVTEANTETTAQKLPCVTFTFGMMYSYLGSHTGRERGEGTLRALSCGYTHWESDHVEQIKVNCKNPLYCHVQSVIKPSMKHEKLSYISIVLKCTGQLSTVSHASCDGTAGYVLHYDECICLHLS